VREHRIVAICVRLQHPSALHATEQSVVSCGETCQIEGGPRVAVAGTEEVPMSPIISAFAVALTAFVTHVGQAAQPTFRVDVGNATGVDKDTVKKAFEARADLYGKCYADAGIVKRLHHPIHGWVSVTIDIRQDGTISVGRIDDQAIGGSSRSESASDFVDCMHDKVLPKLAFPGLDHVQYRTASVTFRVNP
jgi:hypothetical protein